MKTRELVLFPVVLASLWGCPKPAETKDAGHSGGTVDAGVADAGVEEDAGQPLRTVSTDGTIFGKTAVNNLLVDPLFGAVFSSGESFFSLEMRAGDLGRTWGIPSERATPTGTPGLVVSNRTARYSPLTAALFNGGRGPFYVQAWVSLTLDDTNAAAGSDVRVRVGEVWIGDAPGTVFELQYIPGDDVVVNGRTWFHHAATVTADLPATSLFVVESTLADATLYLAGPEVVPESLKNNARGANTLVVYPARQGRWSAADKALMKVAHEKMPGMGTPPAMRQEQIRRDITEGKTRVRPPH